MFEFEKTKIFIVVFALIIVIVGIFYFENSYQSESVLCCEDEQQVEPFGSVLKISGASVDLEMAETLDKRRMGLSGKEDLKKGNGMFFVFDRSDIYGFWMKDMNFPIDILWFDENFRVVSFEKNVQPETFPKIFTPETESLYVLEVNSGFVDQNNITIGEMAEISGDLPQAD